MQCLARERCSASRAKDAVPRAPEKRGQGRVVRARSDAHTEAVPDDARWIEPVVVPDDLRELAADVEAYHRERRSAERRRRLERLTGTRAWRRTAVPLAVVTGALALAGIVFAVLTVGQPRQAGGPSAAPIATAPGAALGQLGGLLPDVTLSTSTGPVSVRDLRPALVALVPARCQCTALIAELAGQADEARVQLVVVAPMAQDAEVAALAGQLHVGHVVAAFDAAGAMASTYTADGVTVLVVARDATVSYVQTAVSHGVRLELPLQRIAQLGE
jgi:hypothetical protein